MEDIKATDTVAVIESLLLKGDVEAAGQLLELTRRNAMVVAHLGFIGLTAIIAGEAIDDL